MYVKAYREFESHPIRTRGGAHGSSDSVKRALCLGIAAAVTSIATAGGAQDTTGAPLPDSTRVATLPAVEIAVTRDIGAARLSAPYAISVSHRNRLDARGQMQDVLAGMPGLFVANRSNPTQDPRIVIRGVGARTAFGVRGVRVLHDGIPLTVADGQTPLDYLDVESVERIEVLRGSASSLYGNSAGGVVAFSSPAFEPAATEATVTAGSLGLVRSRLSTLGRTGSLDYSGAVSHASEDGYRDHSRQRVTRAHAKVRYNLPASSVTAHVLGFDMPLARNPGSLDAAQLAADRRMADPLAVTRGASKRVSQLQAGVTFLRALPRADMSAIVFAGTRALDNPLTFAVIDLDRVSGGLLLRASRRVGASSRLTLGIDVQHQDDDRLEFVNCTGATATSARCAALPAERGALRRSQRERVSSVGPYAMADAGSSRYRLSVGVRADAIAFRVHDRLVTATDPDESGRRSMRAVSPHLGVVALLAGANSLYANVSSGFDTPTATELGNRPDGSAGVNNTLEPQRSRTLEIGAKGALRMVRYDVAAFSTAVRDELVPFEIAGGAGRRFFRNAGRTRRRGIELGLAAEAGRLELRSAATLNHFEFVEFTTAATDFSGNTIPGVPARFADLSAIWSARPVQLEVSGRFASSTIVNDANTARAPGYEILTIRARGSWRVGAVAVVPRIAVDNIFGREYVGAVSVNAAGGRFFEPAPGRTVVGSLTVRF